MGVSKIVYGGNTLIDLTADTVSANKLLLGETAHGADGEPIVGTYEGGGGGGSNALYYDSEGHICIDYDVVKNGGSGGGGGTTFYQILYYNSDGTILLNREYVRKGDDAIYFYVTNEWSDEIGGTAIADVQEDIQSDLTLYYVGFEALSYWDFTTQSINNLVTGESATLVMLPRSNVTVNGLYIDNVRQAIDLGEIFLPGTSLYIEFGDIEFKGNTSSHETLISFGYTDSNSGLIFRASNNYWAIYSGGWYRLNSDWSGDSNRNVFANKTLRIAKSATDVISVYLDNQLIKDGVTSSSTKRIALGNSREQSSGGQCFDVYIKKVYVIKDT